jgi:hypothetical protein
MKAHELSELSKRNWQARLNDEEELLKIFRFNKASSRADWKILQSDKK